MATETTYSLLQRIELTASVSSVTFSSIPTSGYTDLKIEISARGSSPTPTNTENFFNVRPNGSTSNYSYRRLYRDGTSVASDSGFYCFIPSSSATANAFGMTTLYFPNYASTTINKSVQAETFYEANQTGILQGFMQILWADNTAITSIELTNVINSNGTASGFAANSTFSLYGISRLGTTPGIPKAVGGDIVRTDGTYWYHAFLNSGQFIPQTALTCDAIVIGAGGGGSTGGGGAGQIRAFTTQSFVDAIPVVIGAGGAGGLSNTNGINGNSSVLGALSAAIGGGGGGSLDGSDGSTGASGGGGGCSDPTGFAGGSGTAGNNGGSGSPRNAGQGGGGGGGGFGAVGQNASNSTAGNGGAGVNTYSSWASATSTGVSGFFAGGGGGGANLSTQGIGGSGGGGNGFKATGPVAGSSGTANTGSGGGATWNQGSIYQGGSGIVIVRYAV
jgi:hypothetical protein